MKNSQIDRDIQGTEKKLSGFTVARTLIVAFLVAILGIEIWYARNRSSSGGKDADSVPKEGAVDKKTGEQSTGNAAVGRKVEPEIDSATRKMVAKAKASHKTKTQQARRIMEMRRRLDNAKLRFGKAREFARENRSNQVAQEELRKRFEASRQAVVEAALEYRNFLMREGFWARWPRHRKTSLEDYIFELEQMQYPFMGAEPTKTNTDRGGGV